MRDLLKGVLAAPVGHDPEAWMQLIAAKPPKALRVQLAALKGRMAAAKPRPGLVLAERLPALRRKLAAMGVDGLIVPRADAHQGEYVPASEQRLAWLTGFTGSAGMAVVLDDPAALFVDGRYTLQARTRSIRRGSRSSTSRAARPPPGSAPTRARQGAGL